MSGSFSALSNALSALRYNQVAIDVASGNVANVGTDGYARRRVVSQSIGASAVSAIWSRSDGINGGVSAGPIERMVDPLLDARARVEHANSSYLETRASSLARLESALGEPGDNGVSAALADFKSSWSDLANAAGGTGEGAARSQVVAKANTLTAALAAQAKAASAEWSDQHSRLDALVTNVNDVAKDLAKLNDNIATAAASGAPTDQLLDRRDQLTMALSDALGAKVTTNDNGTVNVTVGGQALVNGSTANQLVLTPEPPATIGDEPVTLSIDGTPPTPLTGSDAEHGSAGGLTSLLNHDLPDYMSNLDAVATKLANDVNSVTGTAFFDGTTASGLTVNITAANIPVNTSGTVDGAIAREVAKADLGQDEYRGLVTDFGSKVASAGRQADNQAVLTDQVDTTRESLSGINIDEEMVNLLAAQRGYEGAARVLTTIDSILDTIINRTGLTH